MVAWLALQLAFGDQSGTASQNGAMKQMAQQSYGPALLAIIAIGFVALALWQAMSAIWGHRREDGGKRAGKRAFSALKTVIYLTLALTAFKTATGTSSKGSSTDHYTAELMKEPGGRFLVGAVGAAIIGIGVVLVVKGLKKKFVEDLMPGATSGPSGKAIIRLGQFGYPAKGVAFGLVGALFVTAAWKFNPGKAGGLDVALRQLLDESYGPLLLAIIALGLGAYGLYCFARARYGDTTA